VGADVGGALANAGRVVPPDAARFAHGLHPGLYSVRLPPSGGHQNGAVGWKPVAVAQIAPDQPVQLIV
jgi:hypothetical protein